MKFNFFSLLFFLVLSLGSYAMEKEKEYRFYNEHEHLNQIAQGNTQNTQNIELETNQSESLWTKLPEEIQQIILTYISLNEAKSFSEILEKLNTLGEKPIFSDS